MTDIGGVEFLCSFLIYPGFKAKNNLLSSVEILIGTCLFKLPPNVVLNRNDIVTCLESNFKLRRLPLLVFKHLTLVQVILGDKRLYALCTRKFAVFVFVYSLE